MLFYFSTFSFSSFLLLLFVFDSSFFVFSHFFHFLLLFFFFFFFLLTNCTEQATTQARACALMSTFSCLDVGITRVGPGQYPQYTHAPECGVAHSTHQFITGILLCALDQCPLREGGCGLLSNHATDLGSARAQPCSSPQICSRDAQRAGRRCCQSTERQHQEDLAEDPVSDGVMDNPVVQCCSLPALLWWRWF